MIGPWEIALIVFLILLLWGAKKLPELGRAAADTLKELQRGVRDDDET